MPLDTLKPPSQVVGNYGILEKIAEGGMGTVYKGRHLVSGEIVAIKVVPPQLAKNQIMCKRLEQEYNVARNLDHPNIVRAIDFGYNGPSPYLVMEFVDGESLGQRIERDGKIPETEAIKLIAQVAQGLHAAHQKGMIHRDVKPDNVLVTPGGQAKLTDLGLVKEMETDLNLTRTGRGLGTPHFMAPEQFRNAKNADVRCDIYSLAATLYMMVTGELPFKSCGPLDAWMKKINNDLPTPRSLVPTLSERVDWTIRRAMSPDATQRPSTCREFLEDLTGHATHRLHGDDETGELWYLYYREPDGVVLTLKGKLSSIRRSIKDGKWKQLEQIRVARSKAGPFEPLRNVPDFRDLVVQIDSLATTALNQVPATLPLSEAKKETVAANAATNPTPRPPTKPVVSGKPASGKAPEITVHRWDDSGDSLAGFILTLLAFIAGVAGFLLIPVLRQWGVL